MTDRAVFSVDFELFDQTPAYRSAPGEMDEEAVGLAAADFLLDALADRDATATFFVVSSVAERYPDDVRKIANAGHEIASHTHSHSLLSTLPPADRMEELDRSRTVLEDVTGRSVSGLRAPAFDVPPGHFDDLAAAGYRYDSSIVPARSIPGWYGGEFDLHRPVPATRVRPDAPADLAELPVSVMPGLRLPLSGAWLRFFGPRYTIAGMQLLARRGIAPVLYVHPWELVDLPAVEGVPRRVYWRTGSWMRRAVERVLDAPFSFVSARSVVEGAMAPPSSAGSDEHGSHDTAGTVAGSDDATARDGGTPGAAGEDGPNGNGSTTGAGE